MAEAIKPRVGLLAALAEAESLPWWKRGRGAAATVAEALPRSDSVLPC